MPKKILITGGLGFVGANLAVHMHKEGYKIIVMDNMSRGGSEVNAQMLKRKCPGIEIHRREMDDISEFLDQISFDLIYHLAAQVAVTASYENPRSDFRINAWGTFNLCNNQLVKNSEVPIIFSSTNKVYGDNVNDVPIVELEKRYEFDGIMRKTGIPENFSIDSYKHTPYGCSKLTGDIYVREAKGVVNRFSCMYGENQFGTIDQGWISHFIISKLLKKPLTIFGNGKQVRDILYIKDVVRLLQIQGEKASKIRGEVFNIGGGYNNTISLLELCEMLDIKPKFDDWRPADQKVYYSDISKAKKALKWEPEIDIHRGIALLKKWVQKNLEYWGEKK